MNKFIKSPPGRWWYRIYLFLRTSPSIKVAAVFISILLAASVIITLIEYEKNGEFVSFFDGLWWTIVTIATVGYGEKVPVTVYGKFLAMGIMFLGVGMMGVITGRIASFLLERQMKEEKGLQDHRSMSGHFIVCGWKREMNRVVHEILQSNPVLSPLQIVLLNKASQEDVNILRSDREFKGIKYVNGDYDEERDLVRAGINKAGRILVLADYLTEGTLQQIDSKTVMAVMTIKNLNSRAYVCAELLDTKYEKYLRLTHCDEILLSRDFCRSMLASASAATGLSHIIYELLHGQEGASIVTRSFPPEYIGRPYSDLKEYFSNDRDLLLVGLLENTGNIMMRKKHALREAQKSMEISRIINDLKTAKTLASNAPVINPDPDYTVKKHSLAVVISGKTRVTENEAVS
jgi:voltage-gated potassium channel